MHEFGIARSILNRVIEQVKTSQCQSSKIGIRKIRLKVGDASGLEEESLRFCLEFCSQGSIAEGAIIDIERIPLRAHCQSCGAPVSSKDTQTRCEICGSGDIEIIAGDELFIDSIELE